jgi:hypothetical protein
MSRKRLDAGDWLDEANKILTDELYPKLEMTPVEWWVFFRNVCGTLFGALCVSAGSKKAIETWRSALEHEREMFLKDDKTYLEVRTAFDVRRKGPGWEVEQPVPKKEPKRAAG